MTNWTPNHDRELSACLEKTLAAYQAATLIVAEVETALDQQADAATVLQRLTACTRKLADDEARPRSVWLREQWQARPRHADEEPARRAIRAMLAQHQQTLEELIPRLQAAETKARHQRAALTPRLDDQVKSQRVVSAYAAVVRAS